MNTRHLKYLTTIAEKGSISAAAQELYIEQSALSHCLKKIETEIGLPLFKRTSPIIPTYAGEAFLENAQQILLLERNLYEQMAEIKNKGHGKIAVGAISHLAEIVLTTTWPEYSLKYPEVKLHLTAGKRSVLDPMLESGQIDFLYSSRPKTEEKSGYHSEPLFVQDLMLLTPKIFYEKKLLSYPKQDDDILSVAHQYRDLQFIMLDRNRSLGTTVRKFFQESGITPSVIFELDNMSLCVALAAQGYGVTVAPEYVISGSQWEKYLYAMPFPKKYRRILSIVYLKDMYMPQYLKDYILLSKELFALKYPVRT